MYPNPKECGNLLVHQEAHQATGSDTCNDGKRKRGCRLTQAYPTNEDDGLNALTKDSDEREQEDGVFFRPSLKPATAGVVLGLEGLDELGTPFAAHL